VETPPGAERAGARGKQRFKHAAQGWGRGKGGGGRQRAKWKTHRNLWPSPKFFGAPEKKIFLWPRVKKKNKKTPKKGGGATTRGANLQIGDTQLFLKIFFGKTPPPRKGGGGGAPRGAQNRTVPPKKPRFFFQKNLAGVWQGQLIFKTGGILEKVTIFFHFRLFWGKKGPTFSLKQTC